MSIRVITDQSEVYDFDNGSHWKATYEGRITVYNDDDEEVASFKNWTGVFKI